LEERSVLLLAGLLLLSLSAVIILISIQASADAVYVNITNQTVYVKYGNMTVINFTTTLVNLGWVNNTHIACVYSCLYAYDIQQDCDAISVKVYEGTVLRYQTDFIPSANNTQLCPTDLKGMCYGVALYNISDFQEPAKIVIENLDKNETKGPFTFEFPYQGPTLTGYAQYIPMLVPAGILMGLAGRLSMKNVGIGLFIYGLVAPVFTVLGVELTNIMLVSSFSIILGVVLIWFSNQ